MSLSQGENLINIYIKLFLLFHNMIINGKNNDMGRIKIKIFLVRLLYYGITFNAL